MEAPRTHEGEEQLVYLEKSMGNEHRNRVAKGLSTGGQYAPEAKSEDPAVALGAQDSMEDGDYQEFQGDGNVVENYEIYRDGDSYTGVAKLGEFNVKRLLGATEETDEELDHFEQVMVPGRWMAVEDFVKDRYPDVDIVDGVSETGFDLEIAKQYLRQPTDHQVTTDTWDAAATICNEQDPGTYGSEYAGRLLQEHLDQQVFAERPPFEVGGRWLTGPPADSWEIERASKLGSDLGVVLNHRIAGAIAEKHRDADPAFKQLSSQGYANRTELTEACSKHLEGTEREAMIRYASGQRTTTEVLVNQEPEVHTPCDPEHHQILTEDSPSWEEKRDMATKAVREALAADQSRAMHRDPARILAVLEDQSFLDDASEEARTATDDHPEHFGSYLAHLARRRADGMQ